MCLGAVKIDPDAPEWLREELRQDPTREKWGKGIYPSSNPRVAGQIVYDLKLQSHPVKALLDSGASHCFVDKQWVTERQLPFKVLKQQIPVRQFKGTVEGAVVGLMKAARFQLGEVCYHWDFLVIEGAPSQVVLGMDFICRHRPEFDVFTFQLTPTKASAVASQDTPEAQEGEELEDIHLSFRSVDEDQLRLCAVRCPSLPVTWDEGPESLLLKTTADHLIETAPAGWLVMDPSNYDKKGALSISRPFQSKKRDPLAMIPKASFSPTLSPNLMIMLKWD